METNALGKHAYFAYDARGQLIRTWGDVPYPVQYYYDEQGRRTQMTTYRVEANWSSPTWPEGVSGDVTRWHYDDATGLLASKEDAAGKAVTYTYGAAGRLATRTWARQKPGGGPLRTTYGYDAKTGELVQVDYNDDTTDVSDAYDRLGRQTTVVDAVGTRVFAYDAQTLQLQSETTDGLTPSVLKRYYDPASVKGRAVGMSLDEDYTVGYGYDQAGRMQSVSWTARGQSDTAIYSRVPGSELLAGYATQSGLLTTYAYEAKRDLKTQVSNRWNGSVVSQYDYRYDPIGRRTSVDTSGSAFGPTRFTSWGYDERNQVTSSNRYTGAFMASPNLADEVSGERRGYGYDAIGNRETALDQDGTTSVSYTANDLNQYDAVASASPTYDDDGNLLDDGAKQLAYNAENQLVRVEMPGRSVSRYDYDYIGRRVKKSVEVLDGSGDDYSVTWVYSGWNKIEERKTVGATTTTKNFVWGLDLSQSMEGAGGIGGLLAVVDGSGSPSLFAYDGNGNVSELVNASTGSTDAHYEYDAFGNVITPVSGAAADNAYRFSTKYADDETGLVYYGYRYYDSVSGRWTQKDPSGENGGVNLYAMVANTPTLAIDALGLEIQCSICIDAMLAKYNVEASRTGRAGRNWRYYGTANHLFGGPGASQELLYSEILGTMIKSSRVFRVKDEASLASHIESRIGIVRETERKGFGFSPVVDYRSQEYWQCDLLRNGVCVHQSPRPGVNPVDAARDLRENPGRCSIGCQAAGQLTACAGAGVAELRTGSVSDPADWVPGDLGFIKNVGYTSDQPAAIAGENIIYVGGGLWWGHLSRDNLFLPLETPPTDTATMGHATSWFEEVRRFAPGASPQIDPLRGWPMVGLTQ